MANAGKRKGTAAASREIVALVCAQAVPGEFQPRRVESACTGARLRVSLLPCTSKLEAGHLLAMLDRGADGVLVIGCQPPHCRFQVGSARAARRLAYAQGVLDEIGLGRWRLRIELAGGRSEPEVVRLAEEFAQSVAGQPPNPVRALRQP